MPRGNRTNTWNKGMDYARSPLYIRRRERDGGKAFGGTREYMRKRAIVFARDGACVWCGSTDELRLDHIVERRETPDHSLENLQTLCQPCHVAKTSAFTEALMRLREAHAEEFKAILDGCYAQARADAPRAEVAADPVVQMPLEF